MSKEAFEDWFYVEHESLQAKYDLPYLDLKEISGKGWEASAAVQAERIQDLQDKLHKADSIWQAQEKQVQKLRDRLERAMGAMKFALGNHFHCTIRKKIIETLEEIEKGNRE
jgi:hypothetical protein